MAAVEPGAMVITDAWGGYNGLAALGYDHLPVVESNDPQVAEEYLPIERDEQRNQIASEAVRKRNRDCAIRRDALSSQPRGGDPCTGLNALVIRPILTRDTSIRIMACNNHNGG